MKKKSYPVLAVIALILVITIVAAGFALIRKYTPNKEREDLTTYYNLTSADEVAIVLNNEVTSSKAKIIDGHIYLDYNFVHDFLNARFYWDNNENILLYATSQNLVSAQAEETSYKITKSSADYGRKIVTVSGDTAYVDLDFVKEYSDFIYDYVKNPHRIIITNEWGSYQTASVKRESSLRKKGGIKSPVLETMAAKSEVTVIEQGEKWSKVMSSDGVIGYMKNRTLSNVEQKTRTSDFKEETFAHIKKDSKICMAWHQVTNQTANTAVSTVLANTKGINVLSPTWFYLNDNNGNIANLASLNYVNYCHNHNIEVWALVSNLENKHVDTAEVLTHTSKRQNLVNQIVSMAIQYNLDGINVDFESLNKDKAGDAFIEFIRELSIKCRNNGIVLSIDNYVPTSYTAFYNRKEQANFADYVIIMGYDEHYGGSTEAGSVASLSWVTDGVANTLKEVPADQVILGMPFYTRIWEIPKQQSSDTASDSSDANAVSSKVYGMKAADDVLTTYGATKTWLEDMGQNYSEFSDDTTTYKVWLEDSSSAECRLKLVEENKLAGASFWKLGFETSDIWDMITKYIH